MAKKKIAEIPEGAEEIKVETAAPETTEEVKIQETEETVTETTVKVDALPDHVKAAFKLYPDAEALYVDTKGGVFSADTKPCLIGSAILYKNPYKS